MSKSSKTPPECRILVLKLGAIGDVIHALPVVHSLKRAWPRARITWIVEKAAYALLTHQPDVEEVLLFDKSRIRTLAGIFSYGQELRTELRRRRFDLALDLQGLFKSAALAWLSGAPQRLVYCNSREGSQWISRQICGPHQQGHVVEMLLDVVRYLGVAAEPVAFPLGILPADQAALAQTAADTGLNLLKPYVVLLLGANWPNKRWSVEAFAQVAEWLQQRGIQAVLAGGPAEQPLAAHWPARFGLREAPMDLTGRTQLKELAYLLSRARACVGGDTGPMHLAAALGTPVVALMGPTNPERNGPYGNGHQVLVTPRECAGCWRRQCPDGRDCLEAIHSTIVCGALEKILNGGSTHE
ncbi:MAG TPA: glycosyltransferase family 9 protein [Patescibacteria group bacterium]|nr:glycosyltransferase family 9 protein [Patescibacteria group bacterium]